MRVEYRSKENTALRVYTHLFCAIKRRRSLKHANSNSNDNSIQWSKRANNETKKGANGQRNMLQGSGQAKFNCSHACIQSSKKKCMCFFACSSLVAAAVTDFIQNLEILPLSYCIFHMVRTLCVWQKKYICEKKSYWLKNTKFEDVFVSFVLLSFVLTVIFFWWWPFTRISTAFRILLIYINVQ